MIVTGEVATVKMIQSMYHENVDSDYYTIAIQAMNGTVHNFSTSVDQFEGFGYASLFFVGNVVTATLDICVAGETYYITDDGDKVIHEEDHLHLVEVIPTTKIVMVKEGIPLELANEVINSRTVVVPSTPKFYAKKSDDNSEERVLALVDRWMKLSGIAKDNVERTIESLGYTYVDNTWIKA